MSTTRDLEHAAELLLRVLISVNDGLIARITDCQHGHPGAGRWDVERSSGTPFCWLHEQDVRVCHQDGWGCLADDIVATKSDPTGDAAMRGDIAAGDRRNFDRAVRRICTDIGLLANIAESYPPTRAANKHERQLTADMNDPHCESCSRVEITRGVAWWVEPRTKERTTYKGMLDKPMWLCAWCETHVGQTGLIPSEDEVEQHRAGKRIHCNHPKLAEDVA